MFLKNYLRYALIKAKLANMQILDSRNILLLTPWWRNMYHQLRYEELFISEQFKCGFLQTLRAEKIVD